ncbi:RNA polymerase subunit sigma-70 [Nocardioides sp. GY 10113]|uniref:RNA polymerase subunit sigma-70 n=1 Tax=Nocardioides sp. GY 10113 TaxID=2569761 RepID=UPI0019811CB7|nr:RNA polymerase subunit sigma-70 [Nocardioides sp. GY 10113]
MGDLHELLRAARSGDREAFDELVEPHRTELLVHCYRLLGSYEDAEDALQEALVAAWLGLPGFEGRSSIRTWLYRITTHRCLNHVRAVARRPQIANPLPGSPPSPSSNGEVVWLQPIGDLDLVDLPETAPGPEGRFEMKEAISLAFIRALQQLPAQQRAVLIVRDVLGYSARETAQLLAISVDSANGALKRARARLKEEQVDGTRSREVTGDEQRLVDTFVERFTGGDVAGVVELFDDEIWVRMPPLTLEYHGREAAASFLEAVRAHTASLTSMVPVSCNGQLGWGEYVADPSTGHECLTGVLVLDLRKGAIAALTHFESSVGVKLGLPRMLA